MSRNWNLVEAVERKNLFQVYAQLRGDGRILAVDRDDRKELLVRKSMHTARIIALAHS